MLSYTCIHFFFTSKPRTSPDPFSCPLGNQCVCARRSGCGPTHRDRAPPPVDESLRAIFIHTRVAALTTDRERSRRRCSAVSLCFLCLRFLPWLDLGHALVQRLAPRIHGHQSRDPIPHATKCLSPKRPLFALTDVAFFCFVDVLVDCLFSFVVVDCFVLFFFVSPRGSPSDPFVFSFCLLTNAGEGSEASLFFFFSSSFFCVLSEFRSSHSRAHSIQPASALSAWIMSRAGGSLRERMQGGGAQRAAPVDKFVGLVEKR